MRDRVPAYARGRTLFGLKGNILFAEHLTYDELTRRFRDGAQLIQMPANRLPEMDLPSDHMRLLFAISPAGNLHIVTAAPAGGPGPDDMTIWLASGQASSGAGEAPESAARPVA